MHTAHTPTAIFVCTLVTRQYRKIFKKKILFSQSRYEYYVGLQQKPLKNRKKCVESVWYCLVTYIAILLNTKRQQYDFRRQNKWNLIFMIIVWLCCLVEGDEKMFVCARALAFFHSSRSKRKDKSVMSAVKRWATHNNWIFGSSCF